MKLDDIVPPLELCKLIPAGEFEDSCFVRLSNTKIILFRRSASFSNQPHYPAPTLQEIMTELPASNIYRIKQTWTANFINDSVDNGIKSGSATTAALKLWLKMKGIENE